MMKSNPEFKFLILHSKLLCDPVGIRTRDPQLRRLLLYPAELPDLVGMRLQEETRYTSLACRDSSS